MFKQAFYNFTPLQTQSYDRRTNVHSHTVAFYCTRSSKQYLDITLSITIPWNSILCILRCSLSFFTSQVLTIFCIPFFPLDLSKIMSLCFNAFSPSFAILLFVLSSNVSLVFHRDVACLIFRFSYRASRRLHSKVHQYRPKMLPTPRFACPITASTSETISLIIFTRIRRSLPLTKTLRRHW